MSIKCSIVPVTPYQQNCSIIMCDVTKKAAVVDPGGDIEHILAAAEQLGVASIDKIWLTHGHMDHCAAADVLRKQLGICIEGPHIEDKFWIDQLPQACKMVQFPHADAFVPDRWLQQGDTVSIGEQTLQVLFCPGHTPGHVVFVSNSARLAFVGDVLFQGSIGRTDFPRGNHQQLLDSITEKLWPLGDDITFVPGHGPTSTFGQERRTNPFVADARYR